MTTALEQVLHRIIQRVDIKLGEMGVDVWPMINGLLPSGAQLSGYHGFYGLTSHHGVDYRFTRSSLAGSYFLGKCRVTDAVLYKSDIRGDELRKRGDVFWFRGEGLTVDADEAIDIKNSLLVKTMVHNRSHDPLSLERFAISDTVAAHYANIHGSPTDGCFISPFTTVDRTRANDCVFGAYTYVRAGDINRLDVAPGTTWIREPGNYNFLYRYPPEILARYIRLDPGSRPKGILMDFLENRKDAFHDLFNRVGTSPSVPLPDTASLDRLAVVKPRTRIEDNVLIAQRAFLQNALLGKGSNAQENCYIVNSRLAGYNVAAHGAKIICADLGQNVYVGFNSFLRGRPGCRLTIHSENIVLPHTIIDAERSITVPPGHLIWGAISRPQDLETQSMPLKEFAAVKDGCNRGRMVFEGDGHRFVAAWRNRILHTLAANGAFYNGSNDKGHAQKNQSISFNTLQPYPSGHLAGLCPTIVIR
jgi:carbonic anhydrase/acetyltransferase-like protein (isoleucine patch superfamily)